MPVRFRLSLPLAAALFVAGCSAPPFTQLSGLMLDADLDEVSGLAASHQHADTLWMINDGGNDARVFAVSHRGSKLATLQVAGVDNPTGKTSPRSNWTAATTCWSPTPATTAACARPCNCT